MPAGLEVALLLGAVGAAIGSFLNVVVDRLPAGESLVSPPSHCPHCQTRLRVSDLIPLLSYLRLRGRCRYCGAPIPRRLLLVEAATAGSFAAVGLALGLSLEALVLIFYSAFLIVVAVVDLEKGLILDNVLLAAIPVALLAAVSTGWLGLAEALLAGVGGSGVFLAIYLLSRGGMGLGDVKLAGVVGLMTGIPGVAVALILAAAAGGGVAVALLALRRKGRKDPVPFGPFLALGVAVTLAWGDGLLAWYLGLLGAA